jgi:spore germination cell wall hydrolase CwlJ-like protein
MVSVAAVGMTAATMLFLAEPGFASELGAEAVIPVLSPPPLDSASGNDETGQEAPVENIIEKKDETPVLPTSAAPVTAESLAALVAVTPRPAALDPELRCLAGAVYFESRGESLMGQLAVAHVVINRAQSGRFPTSLCGVVHQKSQFSFVKGGQMPAVREGAQWNNAIAIAQIARDGSWKNHAPGALFFHARHVSPGWRKTRIAQIDNHIFYR